MPLLGETHKLILPAPQTISGSPQVAERVAAALAEMTVADKAAQIATNTPKVNPGIPRIGWPAYGYHSEGLHGLRDSQTAAGLDATIFPQTTGELILVVHFRTRT
jgi:hypothetical protein